jgi:large subunit ribosomal protein L3
MSDAVDTKNGGTELGGLIGRKLGMTQVFTPAGELVPVTVIALGPCTVVATRQKARDGYVAAQLGFEPLKEARLSKPARGQFAKAGTTPFRVLREVRVRGEEPPVVGTQVTVADVFAAGDVVKVTGVSKGRGTAGVVKRHRFAGFPASHGTHEYFRHGGSIGNRSFPGRVLKGKRMSGRMGAEKVTTTNLRVVAVRPDEHVLLIRGAVPGARNGTVMVSKFRGGAR